MTKEYEELFFCDVYERSVDNQHRVAVPSEWRRDCDIRLIMLPGRNRDLLLFPYDMFQDSLKNVRKQALANAKVQAMLAWLGSRIRECRCDKQGRIKLDAKMLASVGIESKLKLVGAATHIKICAPENWIEEPDNQEIYLDELQKISESDGFADLLKGLLDN